MDRQNHKFWISFVRAVAIFLVVWLHVTAAYVYQFNSLPLGVWWVANVYDSIVRVSVPLFFMISGYLLIGKDESSKEFFKKRVRKILIPLIASTVFYIHFAAYHTNTSVTLETYLSVLQTPAYYHLWFLYVIVGLYVLIPLINYFINRLSKEWLYGYLVLWFVGVCVLPVFGKTFNIFNPANLKIILGYTGYLILGYLVGGITVGRKGIIIASIVSIFCVGITSLGTFILTKRAEGELAEYFYNYLSPNIIIFSVAAFMFLKNLGERLDRLEGYFSKGVNLVSSTSLGVYLFHVVFLHYIERGHFDLGMFDNPLYKVPLVTVVVFVLSVCLVVLLKRVPYIRWIVA